MTRKPFIAVNAHEVLQRHGLDSMDALWALQLEAVDAPNTGRGGWSSVHRLELDDANGTSQHFYLKRQDNGEPLTETWIYQWSPPPMDQRDLHNPTHL